MDCLGVSALLCLDSAVHVAQGYASFSIPWDADSCYYNYDKLTWELKGLYFTVRYSELEEL